MAYIPNYHAQVQNVVSWKHAAVVIGAYGMCGGLEKSPCQTVSEHFCVSDWSESNLVSSTCRSR